MIPDPSPPFSVEMRGIFRDQLAAILQRSHQLAIATEIAAMLTNILQKVTMRPRKWGDPLRHFPHTQFTMYRGYDKPLIVYYAVHDRIPIVSLLHLNAHP